MDTIGDAYIVAGLLPSEGDQTLTPGCFDRESARVCQDMLDVAAAMIEALAEHRKSTGQDVDGRIGVSVGMVVAGVLGRLQPRFHIHGPAMRAAEMLEQTGRVGAAHVSDVFLRTLLTAIPGTPPTTTACATKPGDVPGRILWPEMLPPPKGWKIGAVMPRLGVTSPKRSVPTVSQQMTPTTALSGDSPSANGLILSALPRQRKRSEVTPDSAMTKTAVAGEESGGGPCDMSNGRKSALEQGHAHPDRSPQESAAHSQLYGILSSPHLSQPPTPPTPSLEVAEEKAAGHWKSSHPCATPKSPLRGALLLRLWKSGRGVLAGEVESAGGTGAGGWRSSPVANLVFKGSPMSKQDDASAQATEQLKINSASPAAATVKVRLVTLPKLVS